MRNLGVALLVASVATGVAMAATTVSDPKDAGSSRLDLKTVTASASTESVVMTLRTWRPWSTSLLAHAGATRYACVYLWRQGSSTSGNIDFQICATATGGKLKASVYSVAAGSAVKTTTKATRVGDNGLRYKIPRSLFAGDRRFSWFAATRDGGTSSRDPAPNAGPKSTPLP